MGKGFQNFMSKKDFHPSAWWNLKKKWELEQNEALKKKKEEDMRAQYEKEQDILNNKALLGDEKARLGLSFMYDAPAGINCKKEEGPEPKFEWQRKYNAPREEWAKGNELIQDQPFGIQVRNVRCVKCRTWGHLNTDRECPLYGMSGNADDPGYANNPSDLIRQVNTDRVGDVKPSASTLVKTEIKYSLHASTSYSNGGIKADPEMHGPSEFPGVGAAGKTSVDADEGHFEVEADEFYEAEVQAMRVPIDQDTLLENMREEHNLRLKTGVLMGVRAEEGIRKLTAAVAENVPEEKAEDTKPSMQEFFNGMSDKKRRKLMNKIKQERSPPPSGSRVDKKKKKHKKLSKERHSKSDAKPTFTEYLASMSEKKRKKLLGKIVKKEEHSTSPEPSGSTDRREKHSSKKSKKHKKESRKENRRRRSSSSSSD